MAQSYKRRTELCSESTESLKYFLRQWAHFGSRVARVEHFLWLWQPDFKRSEIHLVYSVKKQGLICNIRTCLLWKLAVELVQLLLKQKRPHDNQPKELLSLTKNPRCCKHTAWYVCRLKSRIVYSVRLKATVEATALLITTLFVTVEMVSRRWLLSQECPIKDVKEQMSLFLLPLL